MELLRFELIQGDPPALRIDGEIDLSTADQLRTALDKAYSADPTVVLDMAAVTFLDATGLRVLLQVAATRNGAGPLPLVNASRVAWLLELVGLSGLTSIDIRDPGEARGR
jgi:anti-anti-sigma factor